MSECRKLSLDAKAVQILLKVNPVNHGPVQAAPPVIMNTCYFATLCQDPWNALKKICRVAEFTETSATLSVVYTKRWLHLF